jgi:hypothetical protein
MDQQIQRRAAFEGGGTDLAPRVAERRVRPRAVRSEVVVRGESASMLRVITERQGDRYRFDLHGTLGGEWVGVLEQHWRSIMDHVPSAKVTLALSNVDFIDPDGEQLLQRMADEDVEFVVAGCMNRYVIDRLKPAVRVAEGGRR